MSKSIGTATFVLTLCLALWGHRAESFDEPARNLVSNREERAARAEERQRLMATNRLEGLQPIEQLLAAPEGMRDPATESMGLQ